MNFELSLEFTDMALSPLWDSEFLGIPSIRDMGNSATKITISSNNSVIVEEVYSSEATAISFLLANAILLKQKRLNIMSLYLEPTFYVEYSEEKFSFSRKDFQVSGRLSDCVYKFEKIGLEVWQASDCLNSNIEFYNPAIAKVIASYEKFGFSS